MYLPFTQIFISNDKLHKTNYSYFINNDQLFVDSDIMKKDLEQLVAYYRAKSGAPSQNLIELIKYPPLEGDFLVSKLYDQFHPGWREHARNPIEVTSELSESINSQLDIDYKNLNGELVKPTIHERNDIPASWLRFT